MAICGRAARPTREGARFCNRRAEFLDARAECHLHLGTVLRLAQEPSADDEIRAAITLYEQKGNLVGAAYAAALLG